VRTDLRNRAVFITGGAGSIGSETAREFGKRGAKLTIVDTDEGRLAQVASELKSPVLPVLADVANPAAIEEAVTASVQEFGRIDVLVAGAAIDRPASLATADPREFQEVVEVDLLGVWRTMRASFRHLIKTKGYVLVVSSLAGLVQGPLMGAYAASKAGVHALANVLRVEVQGLGVDVGIAFLGVFETEFARQGFSHPVAASLLDVIPKWQRRVLTSGGPPDVAARAIVRATQKRKRVLVVPRSGLAAYYFPWAFQQLIEGHARRYGFSDLIRRSSR
jgi:NAD(P)-dependent dehydrogenase (short-subunit alcohol dehydrogenase family)